MKGARIITPFIFLSATLGHDGYHLLADLPEEHPLRNTPLGEIKAEYRNVKSFKGWMPVLERTDLHTYNELAGPYIEFNEWRCPVNVFIDSVSRE